MQPAAVLIKRAFSKIQVCDDFVKSPDFPFAKSLFKSRAPFGQIPGAWPLCSSDSLELLTPNGAAPFAEKS